MATVRERVKKDGTATYQVRWVDRRTGKQTSETFARETDARQFRGLVDGARQTLPAGWVSGLGFIEADDPDSDWTVSSWATYAIAARSGITPNTRDGYQRQIRKHFHPIGAQPLSMLRRSLVSAWIGELTERGLSPKSVADMHGLLSSVLNDAVRDGIIDGNVAEGLKLPARHGIAAPKMVVLTRAERQRLIDATDPQYRLFVDLLAETGLRISEAAALEARHFIAPGRIIVEQSLRRDPGGTVVAPTKTRRSVRTISVTPRLGLLLAAHVHNLAGEDHIFRTAQGARIHVPRSRSVYWNAAVEKAGLRPSPTPHDLRHSHASELLGAGVPIFKVQRRLGHESIATTADTYGHLMPDSDDEIIAALEHSGGLAEMRH